MTTYIALLRGINVNGKNLIKMADLRAICQEMGLGAVQTYIQSGNILFRSDEEKEPLRRRIEQAIQASFGLSVPVVLRTADDLRQITLRCPFPADELAEGESLCLSLLGDAPSQEAIDRLLTYQSEIDEYRLIGQEVYILCRQPYHKSKLTNQLFEQKLRVPCTQRNWQTISKLLALAQLME